MKKFFSFHFFNCAPKKIGMTLCFSLCILNCAFSQNPLVKMWDKDFGGTDYDWLYALQQTSDSGFILGGHSESSINGDKTQATWGYFDYWILKTDASGNKQWDKDFGGSAVDNLSSLYLTQDHGYILGGYSSSPVSGDKTQACWGSTDYWIVKTDSLGNKLWDKNFGGTGEDQLLDLATTSDGGYLLGGWSGSPISGDKTDSVWGTAGVDWDYWVVKTDSLGNKQWDKDFGGTLIDQIWSLKQTSDGGYILGGLSASPISGNKTQGVRGSYDYWIIKIDSLGNQLWDKDFGGTGNDRLTSVNQTLDGGFIIGGSSDSPAGGDKTQSGWGGFDYWIVKTDSLGNKMWDKDFGGNAGEELTAVIQTTDGGYLISGDSYSSISGDKSENNLGYEQTWILKTDSLGNKLWDKTILTSGHDEHGLAIEINGCYLAGNFTYGDSAGDKTQPSWGGYDYWIIKFCDSTMSLLPSAAAVAASTTICPGTCASFLNFSTNATTYQWSFSGATPSTSTDINPTNICYPTPGSYNVQLIATNANGSDTLLLTNYITVYPSPLPQSITQSGDTLFAIQGLATYQWYFNTNIINGATDYFYVATSSGDYNVVATDVNGCEVEAVVFNVNVGLTPALSKGEGVMVFPNPVGDKLMIQMSRYKRETANEISIYNVLGEMVLVQRTPFGAAPLQTAYCLSAEGRIRLGELPTYSIDVHALPAGLYYLEVNSTGKTFRCTFVKQ